ncbi:MAG: type I-E CRISPR-associated protein Cas7/Cse4/CasC [Propionivibrio sp.]|uniref:type I-E CRISPR-associated protein Cas7/Cse4/CasC n=1 Tax=Propionivibrio sp. TaxID=2212460 RepID=UPI0025F3692A|nr:type I-E CRISPR-associated protein Cas7/Cse4/CasC [Propionivibrio sp.]MBK8895260.1 type I-E CRISPR-associated protein Cas7/Cse4/CasC [Propionivibrio sp.]MBL0208958.1 type I-E CRISPR-associated protein Cas7/Cse4/CasC [Propionivibrio sp.]
MKTIVEIHALQNFAPSNLNRDDTGAPKDALFGGSRRARVSSQCSKRSVRQYFASLVEQNILSSDDVAVRTKRVLDALTQSLVGMERSEGEAREKVRLALAAMELSVKDDGKSEYLLFLGQREILDIAEIINEKWDSIAAATNPVPAEGKKPGKAKKQAAQSADPDLKKALDKVFNGGKALDVALFGRMLADMPEKNQHAACQVAHALSTHAIEREFDFFTAVDDLKPEDSAGADMMGTVEFNSACFYRYAVVDWGKLVSNLQDDADLPARGLRAFLEGFVVAEPTGKQNTFAAHNAPEFVAVTVRRNTAPRSLANAFETAIRVKRDESLTQKSAEALVRKAKVLQSAYGGDEKTFILDLTGANLDGFGRSFSSLQELLDAAVAAVRE